MSAHEIDDFEQIHLSQNDAVEAPSPHCRRSMRYDRAQSRATICDGLPTCCYRKSPDLPTSKVNAPAQLGVAAVHKRNQLQHSATERNTWCARVALGELSDAARSCLSAEPRPGTQRVVLVPPIPYR